MKRYLAVILAMALCFGTMATVGAAEPEATTGNLYEGNFQYRETSDRRYSVSTAVGCVAEMGKDTITINVSGEYYKNLDVSQLTFEKERIKNDLQTLDLKVGDEIVVLYRSDWIIGYVQTAESLMEWKEEPRIAYFVQKLDEPLTLESKKEFLEIMGIIDTDKFPEISMEKEMTRGEMAALLCHLSSVNGSVLEELPFTDIKGTPFQEEIKIAYEVGYISGKSNTIFAPEELVTNTDAIVMVMRANGNEKLNQEIERKGGYPKGYLAAAKAYKLIETEKSGNATWGDVIDLLYNTFRLDDMIQPVGAAKPVLYFYPEEKTEVSVTLDLMGELGFTYPDYGNGWEVVAEPDGTLHQNGKEYSYLFWEGDLKEFPVDFSKGFLVKKEDTISFLQKVLTEQGLTPKEYNEFIVYWAPKLMEHEWNQIYFAGVEYEEQAKLTVSPEPDSLLRVYMVFQEAEGTEQLEPQVFQPFERKGFTVVEWGGCEVEKK